MKLCNIQVLYLYYFTYFLSSCSLRIPLNISAYS
uniref:Lipoprotein n=1 Tax=Myoviridae sp. ct4QN2 TaxID=2825030 RepID=A0A8S5PUI5_9CAUD|nr:MAG TPA: hypothetical protein [Myoviridae sp. ct4QN2]